MPGYTFIEAGTRGMGKTQAMFTRFRRLHCRKYRLAKDGYNWKNPEHL